ncbi:MAG TPA: Ig-like domain-containing protein [Verrucomicrobiae bacterium]
MKTKPEDHPGGGPEPGKGRSNFWKGVRGACAGLICLGILAGVVWLVQRSSRPERLTYTPTVSQAEAEALVARMLVTNSSWLAPAPVRATYWFQRKVNTWSPGSAWQQRSWRKLRTHEEELVGPFTARWKSDGSLRVGVTLQTPLTSMRADRNNYTIQAMGTAKWRGKTVVAVDITFQHPEGGRVGMGAGRVGYSSAGFSARSARILIDPLKAVPLFIATSDSGSSSVSRRGDSTFLFGSEFLLVPSGYAPRFIEWRRPDLSWRSRYEFQVTGGHWFFRRGRASIRTDRWSHLNQQLETTRLQMEPLRPGDLLQEYPTQLTAGDPAPEHARPWRFEREDIFHVSKFGLTVGQELRVELGDADLGIGYCDDGALWAVLIPREGGMISSRAAAGPEQPAHIWLRFHPRDIGRLFPPETITADGAEELEPKMCAIANLKMMSSWSAEGMATIPGPGQMTVDVDTTNGLRRFFTVDTQAGTALYSAEFETRGVNLSPEAVEVMSEPLPDHRKTLAEQSSDQSRPKVVSVFPAPGAQGVAPATDLRIRFDRPMDPLALKLDWESGDFRSVEFPRYDSNTFEFTLPMHLVPGVLHQIALNKEQAGFGGGFLSADAQPARLYVWRFTTERTAAANGLLLAPPAGSESVAGSKSNEGELLSLLQRMQQRRAGITSIVERAQQLSQFHGRGLRLLSTQGAVFRWQQPSQFYGDVSQIMGGLFRVGCDGQNWWWEMGSRARPDQVLCPTNEMQIQNVSIADPFGLTEDSPAVAVKNLGLAFGGATHWDGTDCYVVEARSGPPSATPASRWWIDVQTLLVAGQEAGGIRTRFIYDSVNHPVPSSAFAPTRTRGVKAQGPEALDAAYTNRFVNVCDGSNGRMSVRWGKIGPGGRSSSGLN